MAGARNRTMFICSLCEKPTSRNIVKIRRNPDRQEVTGSFEYHSQWQCSHCKAWHNTDDDFYRPELIQ